MTPALLLRFARLAALGGLVALLIAAGERGIAELPGRLVDAVIAPVRSPIDDAPIADLLFAAAGLLALAGAALGAYRAATTRAAAIRAMGGPTPTRPTPARAERPAVAAEPTPSAGDRFARLRETLMARRDKDES
jgi:hypothetical protein